jgi:hypothetical protein
MGDDEENQKEVENGTMGDVEENQENHYVTGKSDEHVPFLDNKQDSELKRPTTVY